MLEDLFRKYAKADHEFMNREDFEECADNVTFREMINPQPKKREAEKVEFRMMEVIPAPGPAERDVASAASPDSPPAVVASVAEPDAKPARQSSEPSAASSSKNESGGNSNDTLDSELTSDVAFARRWTVILNGGKNARSDPPVRRVHLSGHGRSRPNQKRGGWGKRKHKHAPKRRLLHRSH